MGSSTSSDPKETFHPKEAFHLLMSNPPKYGTNRSLILAALSYNNGKCRLYSGINCLQYASDKLKDAKEVVLLAVGQSGLALEFASATLRGDKQIVIVACNQDGRALRYASDEMKDCTDVVCGALTKAKSDDGYTGYTGFCNILGLASPGIRAKLNAFGAMVNSDDGILRSLDKDDPLALSAHLEFKFGLRRVFLEPSLCSGISPRRRKRCQRDDGCTKIIPHALVKHVADYAGLPVGAELRQLQLVLEILPIVTAIAKQNSGIWCPNFFGRLRTAVTTTDD